MCLFCLETIKIVSLCSILIFFISKTVKFNNLSKTHTNIPIFIPELACPHQCVFCNQMKISGMPAIPSPNEIRNIIETHLKTIPKERTIQIAFFGGSFTGIPIDLQQKYLKEAFHYIEKKEVESIRISTRPDYINEEILIMLKKYGVKSIELGAQSTDEYVLKKSGRGHSFSDIQNAAKLIKDYNFELGLQMMIGLPGDTLEKSNETAHNIVNLKADNTRIYPTLVVKDTALEIMFNQGKYKPLSLQEAIFQTKEIVKIFESAKVNILRIGLHASEDLIEGKNLVAGPIHRSFKELVMTEFWFDILVDKLKNSQEKELGITVNPSQYNFAIGYEGKNKKHFYNLGVNLKFKTNKLLEKFEIQIE